MGTAALTWMPRPQSIRDPKADNGDSSNSSFLAKLVLFWLEPSYRPPCGPSATPQWLHVSARPGRFGRVSIPADTALFNPSVKQFIRNVRAAKTIADERAVIQKESAAIRASFREESGDHAVR